MVADGEVVFVAYDVNKAVEASHDVNKAKPTELPLSKKRQASGRLNSFDINNQEQ